jgi:leucyl aminopeptidase
LPACLLPATSAVPAVPVAAVTADALPASLATLDRRAVDWVRAAGFTAVAGEVVVIPDAEGAIASVFFGFGNGDREPSLLPGKLPGALPGGTYRLRGGFGDPALACLAFALGAYRFSRYRQDKAEPRRLVLPERVDKVDVARIADGVYLARDLINTAANDLGPAELAAAAGDLAPAATARCSRRSSATPFSPTAFR